MNKQAYEQGKTIGLLIKRGAKRSHPFLQNFINPPTVEGFAVGAVQGAARGAVIGPAVYGLITGLERYSNSAPGHGSREFTKGLLQGAAKGAIPGIAIGGLVEGIRGGIDGYIANQEMLNSW